MKRFCSLAAFAVFFLLLGLSPAVAQVSNDFQTDVVVKVDGVDETFTILRHYSKTDQFYYVPNAPRLATTGMGASKKPIFHLLSYQAKNTETNDLVDGGIMQFSVRLAPPAEVVSQMRSQIASQFSIPENTIKLTPLPFKSAEIAVYNLKGELLKTEFQKPGIAPAFANSEIPFQVQLNSLTSDVYKALVTGGGGIPVYITYTFDQVTPETGFKVTVNWDKSYKHFSEDKRTKTAYTRWYYYRTWWGGWRSRADVGQNESRQQTLSDILQENQSVKYESVAGDNFTQDEITKLMDPIIEQVSKELVATVQPPEKIEAAAAKEPENATLWGGTSTYAMKSVENIRKGSQVIEMKRRQLFESKSTYGSLLGIGRYNDDVKKQCVTIMPAGNWSYAYFPVPAVGDGKELAIEKIDLQVVPKYRDEDGKLHQIKGAMAELVTWTPKKKCFVDRKDNRVTNILFPLQSITEKLAEDKIPLSSCTYEVTTTVTQNNDELEFRSYEDFVLGGIPVSTPMARIEGVEVDCDPLTFGDKKGDLYQVSISVDSTYPEKSYNKTIKADTEIKNPVFLVEKEDKGKKNPITANIKFTLRGSSKKVPWAFNDRNLQDSDLGLSVVLWDEDYQPAKK